MVKLLTVWILFANKNELISHGWPIHIRARLRSTLPPAVQQKINQQLQSRLENMTVTSPEAAHRIGDLAEEIGVTKHVLVLNDKTEKGHAGIADIKHECLIPDRVQTIVR